jgi:tRNA threonylcarbamoyl adenosine modification protein (Sua5/YciO/YrdC/YwlC family)
LAIHIYTWIDPVRESHMTKVSEALANGGVIAIPMDVAWVFACAAGNSKAVERIRRIKPDHPQNQPFSLVCSSISMASTICTIGDQEYRWLKKSLPGPFTVILARHASLPRLIKDKRKEVGLRIPKNPLVTAIIAAFGAPLAVSTIRLPHAEDPGGLPSFGGQVDESWGHCIDMIVDLGEESPREETTVINLSTGFPELVRLGAGDPSLFGL